LKGVFSLTDRKNRVPLSFGILQRLKVLNYHRDLNLIKSNVSLLVLMAIFVIFV